jgi:magnesium transporter
VNTESVQESALTLRHAVAMDTPKAVELWLEVVDDPAERVRQLARLSSADRHRLGELLNPQTGTELFESIDYSLAAKVVKSQPVSRGAELIGALQPHRAADILRRFDNAARDALLTAMPIERAKLLRGSLYWSTDCVAAHMMTEPITLTQTTTAEQAVEQIRARMTQRRRDTRVGAQVYVTDPDQHLIGAVPFRELVLAEANAQVSDLSEGEVVTTGPLTAAEEAAHLLVDRRLSEMPVVDADGRLLGVLTEADALDIIEVQATEDAEKQGGSTPLDVPYLSASPWLLWRKRIVWLLVLFAAEAYTGTVLRAFEDEMEAVVALAFFIPLLIGTGGNTGTQITTTLVRAMGTGQVRLRDLPAVVAKELTTGAMIAVMMALAAMIRAWTLGVGPQITVTVCVTVAAIVMWSAFVSSILPLVLKKVRIDPAVVSAPLIATIVDGTGLMIYFMVAHATLPQLAGL